MEKKLKILFGVLITVSLIATGVSAYWVYSDVVGHDVTENHPSLTVESEGKEVTLTVTGVENGKTVQFGTSSSDPAGDGSFSWLGESTVVSGSAVFVYTAPAVGHYDYVARAYNTDIP